MLVSFAYPETRYDPARLCITLILAAGSPAAVIAICLALRTGVRPAAAGWRRSRGHAGPGARPARPGDPAAAQAGRSAATSGSRVTRADCGCWPGTFQQRPHLLDLAAGPAPCRGRG